VTRADRDLIGVTAAAVACAVVAAAVRITAVRAVAAVPLCLVLPGYALAAAIFLRPRQRGAQGAMLVLAMSLATLVLGSLLLDAVPGGLQLASWAVLLVVVVVAGCAVAAVRRQRIVAGSQTAQPRRRRLRVRITDVVLIVAAALAVSAALGLSRTPLPAKNAIGYTQLWMLQTGTPQSPAVRIGITSAEQHPTTYTLTLGSGTGSPTAIETGLRLRPGASSEVSVPITTVAPHARTLIVAQLFRSGVPGVYRQVTAVIAPPPSQTASPQGQAASAHRRATRR
jgi:hypothetical protein